MGQLGDRLIGRLVDWSTLAPRCGAGQALVNWSLGNELPHHQLPNYQLPIYQLTIYQLTPYRSGLYLW